MPRPAARELPPGERPSLADEAMRGYRGEPDVQVRRAERPAAAPRAAAPPPEPAPHYPPHEFDQLEPPIHEEWSAHPEHRPPQPVDFDSDQRPRARPTRRIEPGEPEEPVRTRSYRGLIRTVVLLLIVGALGALAWWQRDAITDAANSVVALVRGPSAPAPREATPARPKITDRIGQPGTQPSGAPAVAQRVVLYEEDPDDPQGKRLVGSAIWRTETIPATPGRAAELAVRADVEVPERRMTMTWSLRRNTDPALPASHTIEIMFNLPQDAPSGGVQNVPGVLMKQAEQTRGVPLAGLAVKVTPGFFLIGLSSLESDMQRNIQLLKERSWFDVPIVYNNNRRALLAMEKGTPGERAFAEAFAAWKQ
jgi:hypothetical protein